MKFEGKKHFFTPFEGKKHFFTPFEGKKQFFTSNEGNPFHVTLLVSPTSEKGWPGSEENILFNSCPHYSIA